MQVKRAVCTRPLQEDQDLLLLERAAGDDEVVPELIVHALPDARDQALESAAQRHGAMQALDLLQRARIEQYQAERTIFRQRGHEALELIGQGGQQAGAEARDQPVARADAVLVGGFVVDHSGPDGKSHRWIG